MAVKPKISKELVERCGWKGLKVIVGDEAQRPMSRQWLKVTRAILNEASKPGKKS